MGFQRAIFVPGRGVPETLESIRFTPLPQRTVPAIGAAAAHPFARLEVYRGDLYGEPVGQMLRSFSTIDRAATEFAGMESLVVPPQRSVVVLVHDSTTGWQIEFRSVLTDAKGSTFRRTVTIDEYATVRETLVGAAGRPDVGPRDVRSSVPSMH
jgi:hypothetical protein